jgi:RNA polymerase sigma factor (sigma-70 family)
MPPTKRRLAVEAKIFSKKARGGAFNWRTLMATELPNPRAPAHDQAGSFLERTFAEQRAPLTRYATRLLGGDVDRAHDVVQDTFVKLMAQPAESVEGHAVEWLFTVCRHRALDVLRKESRMRTFGEGEAERVTAADPRPGRTLEHAETQAALLQLIGHLPANQQEVVRLKFQNGFSYKEIARITELSVSNVGFLIHTAVARLRTEFAAQRP